MPSLHHMFRLMRSIIMLNDTQVRARVQAAEAVAATAAATAAAAVVAAGTAEAAQAVFSQPRIARHAHLGAWGSDYVRRASAGGGSWHASKN